MSESHDDTLVLAFNNKCEGDTAQHRENLSELGKHYAAITNLMRYFDPPRIMKVSDEGADWDLLIRRISRLDELPALQSTDQLEKLIHSRLTRVMLDDEKWVKDAVRRISGAFAADNSVETKLDVALTVLMEVL